MRTLPTVKLQACSLAGTHCFKTFFPFDNAALRARLEQFGLYYDAHQRFQMLCLVPEALEQMKAALREEAFVYVEQAANQAPNPGARARPFAQAPPTLDDLPPNFVRVTVPEAQTPLVSKPKTPPQAAAASSPVHSSGTLTESVPLTASCVLYYGEERIRLSVPPGFTFHPLFQQLRICRWSPAMNAWHVAKTTEAWEQVIAVFPKVDILKTNTGLSLPEFTELPPGAVAPALPSEYVPAPARPPASPHQKPLANSAAVLHLAPDCLRIEPENRFRMKAFVPKHREDWKEKVRTIPDRAWNDIKKYWSLPMAKPIIKQLKEMFGEALQLSPDLPTDMPENYVPKYPKAKPPETNARSISQTPQPSAPKEDVVMVRYATGIEDRVFLQVPPQRTDWIAVLKTIPDKQWLPFDFLWEVPRTKENLIMMRHLLGDKLVIDKANFITLTPLPSPQPAKKEVPIASEPSIEKPMPAPPKSGGTSETNILTFPRPVEHRLLFAPANVTKPLIQMMNIGTETKRVVCGDLVIVEPWDEHWCCAYVPGDRADWVEAIKQIAGRQWNPKETAWWLPMTKETQLDLVALFDAHLCLNLDFPPHLPHRWIAPATMKAMFKAPASPLNEMQQLAISALEDRLFLECKSRRTIKTYKNSVAGLLAFYPKVKPSQISIAQINAYIVYKRKEKNIDNRTVDSLISAFNAFFGRLLGQTDKVQELQRPKKQDKLPNVVSKEEIMELLNAVDNEKHKCMLLLIYSAGLRKSETLNLRVRDLNVHRETLFVKNGKGGKDRQTFYCPDAIRHVSKYIQKYKPRYWLFEGQTKEQYSESGLQSIFEKAREKSGINPDLTIHGLRHCFGTHLQEAGVPIQKIKELMGHVNIATTEVYLHLSAKYKEQIQSPFQGLGL